MKKNKQIKKIDLISIIIPIYNKEKYVERCIKSVINQSYKNIEIILIDDASTDNSLAICEKYKEKDNRIIILKNKTNRGVSYSRNRGIKVAKGSYIGFVDADDYVEKNMYEVMYDKALKNDLDICKTSICVDGYELPVVYENVLLIDDKEEMIDYFLKNIISFMACDKLFKKKIVGFFKEDFRRNEDGLFVFDAIMKSKKIGITNDILYNYMNDDNDSLTKNFNFDMDKNIFYTIDYVENEILPKYHNLRETFYYYKLESLYYFYINLHDNYNNKYNNNIELYNITNETKKFIESILPKYKNVKNKCLKLLDILDELENNRK